MLLLRRVATVAVSLLANALSATVSEARSLDEIRAEYAAAMSTAYCQRELYDFPDLLNTDTQAALNKAWWLIAEAAAAYLNETPDAPVDALAHRIETLVPAGPCASGPDDWRTLRASAILLRDGGDAAYAVAANFSVIGMFFVVAREAGGPFRAAWNIKDTAPEHYAKRDQIGYWAHDSMGWGDGPLTASVRPLPATSAGNPRFYVDASSNPTMGCTSAQQIGVWEWDGKTVKPLFLKCYQRCTCEDERHVELVDNTLRVPMKGPLKAFWTAGQDPLPLVTWSIRITPGGVEDLGQQWDDPVLRFVDDFFYRVLHKHSTADVARPEATKALAKLLASRGDGRADSDNGGELWFNSVKSQGARLVTLVVDGLDEPVGILLVERDGKPFVAAVTETRRPPEPTRTKRKASSR